MNYTFVLGFIVILLVSVSTFSYFVFMTQTTPPSVTMISTSTAAATPVVVATAFFLCQNNQSITATFYDNPEQVNQASAGQPLPTGSVVLDFSKGTTITLPQTPSADGVRYASLDDTTVFWNKGNGAQVTLDGNSTDYFGCVLVSPDTNQVSLPSSYVDAGATFSIRLPNLGNASSSFTVNPTYIKELDPTHIIPGDKFIIPANMASGTNLSNDTYLSIEHMASTSRCNAKDFMYPDEEIVVSTTTDTGINYSFARTSGAAALNRYEELVYVLSDSIPCTAIRYFLHYSEINSYPPDTVSEFDRNKVLSIFDAIRHSLVLN